MLFLLVCIVRFVGFVYKPVIFYRLISIFEVTVPCICVPAGISALPPLIRKPNKQQIVKTIDNASLLPP